VLGNPIKYIDPLGLDTLVTDGKTVNHYNDAGTKIGSYPYTSGETGVTDPSIPWKGPIPPGTYTLDPKDISKGSFLRDLTGDWGDFRVPLKATDSTNTFGRDGFFLHGGTDPGSAGCLDVGSRDSELIGPMSPISLHDGVVKVIVK
jgi:hypothetical protein